MENKCQKNCTKFEKRQETRNSILRETTEDTIHKTIFCIVRRSSVVNMPIVSKPIYTFNIVLIKIPILGEKRHLKS